VNFLQRIFGRGKVNLGVSRSDEKRVEEMERNMTVLEKRLELMKLEREIHERTS
jgi:methionine synthase II (cobalamin-independent)